MRIKNFLFLTTIIILVILSSPIGLLADDGNAGWAGAALRMGFGARASGMGDAYTSLAHGASAVYWNPAALPRERVREVTFAYSHLPWDRKLSYAALKVPVEPSAGIGLAWIHAGVDDIDGRDYNGQPTGNLISAENAFCLAFGAQLSPYLNVGLDMKYYYYKLADISATAFGFDAAVFSSPYEHLNLGLVIGDLNAKYTWDTEEVWARGTTTYDKFPVNTRLGASYQVFRDRVTMAVDVEKNQEQDTQWHFGTEIALDPALQVRMGFNDGTMVVGSSLILMTWDNLLKPISSRIMHLDYALFVDSVTDQASHIFGWHFQF